MEMDNNCRSLLQDVSLVLQNKRPVQRMKQVRQTPRPLIQVLHRRNIKNEASVDHCSPTCCQEEVAIQTCQGKEIGGV